MIGVYEMPRWSNRLREGRKDHAFQKEAHQDSWPPPMNEDDARRDRQVEQKRTGRRPKSLGDQLAKTKYYKGSQPRPPRQRRFIMWLLCIQHETDAGEFTFRFPSLGINILTRAFSKVIMTNDLHHRKKRFSTKML